MGGGAFLILFYLYCNLRRKIVIYIKKNSKLEHNGDLTTSRTYMHLFIYFFFYFLAIVTILATSYFTRNVFGKCLPIQYNNRSPGKSKQDIHLIF